MSSSESVVEKHHVNSKLPTRARNESKSDEHDDDDDYDPHLHRSQHVSHPTSNWVTLIHLLKALIGTGIFAMPKAFQQGGYALGTVFTVLVGIMLTYCIHILVRCQHILCKRHRIPSLTYSMSMKVALEEGPPFLRPLVPYAATVVNSFILINQIGICCIYIVFISKNLKTVIGTWFEMDEEYYMLLLLGPLMLLMCIRNLRMLAPFTMLANLVVFIGIGIIFSHTFKDTPSISERNAVGNILNFPLFFGTTLFALVAINIVTSLENNMKTPKKFSWVLNTGMAFVTLLYIAFGFMAYLKYGNDIADTVTLNLPPGETSTKVVQVLFSLSTFVSYGLQSYVVIEIIWGKLSAHFNDQLKWELIVRFSIVLFTFLLAISVKDLSLFISFVGALCMSMLGVAFPALIDICVLYPFNLGRYNYILIRNVILIVIGVLALVTGTSKSINDLIQHYS